MRKVKVINIMHLILVNITAGCVDGCSGHGICTTEDGQYLCECSSGWTGPDCSVQLETQCSDEKDNDGGKLMLYSVMLN